MARRERRLPDNIFAGPERVRQILGVGDAAGINPTKLRPISGRENTSGSRKEDEDTRSRHRNEYTLRGRSVRSVLYGVGLNWNVSVLVCTTSRPGPSGADQY